MAVANLDEWLVNLLTPKERCPVLQAAFGTICSVRLRGARSNLVVAQTYERLVLEALADGLGGLHLVGTGAATIITKRNDCHPGWDGPEHVTTESFFAAANEDCDGGRRTAENLFRLLHAARVSVCARRLEGQVGRNQTNRSACRTYPHLLPCPVVLSVSNSLSRSLSLSLHPRSSLCQCPEMNGRCKVVWCEESKSLWAHVRSCALPTCDFPDCSLASWQVITFNHKLALYLQSIHDR